MAALVDITGKQERRYELGQRNVMGRDPACSIPLPDPSVSRKHAEVRKLQTGEFQLVNLSATNGSYVDNRPVSEHILSDGEEIIVGSTKLRFESDPPAPLVEIDPSLSSGGSFGEFGDIETRPAGIPSRRMTTGESMSVVRVALSDSTTATPSAQAPGIDVDHRFLPQNEIGDEKELRRNYEKLRAAWELTQAIGTEEDLDCILLRIVETAIELLNADRVAVLLIDPQSQKPVPRVARQRGGDSEASDEIVLSASIINEVVSNKTAVLSEDLGSDARFARAMSIISQGIRSAMCVPMLHKGELLGVIHLDSLVSNTLFDAGDLEVFSSIASQAAAVVRNALLREEIRELERQRVSSIQTLVSGASHFINNPLAIIQSNLSMLRQWANDLTAFHHGIRQSHNIQADLANLEMDHNIEFIDAELGPLSAESLSGGERIRGIVEALRMFEQSSGEPPESMSVRAIIGEVQRIHASEIDCRCQFITDVAESQTLFGVRDRIRQMISNLIKNAYEAIAPDDPEAHSIVVSCSQAGTELKLRVTDTGAGLPVGEESKVFVPFYTSRLDGSLGLGLAVAQEIAHQHGGSIRAFPREGDRTVFETTLPLGPRT